MLDLSDLEVDSSDIIEERLFFAAAHHAGQGRHHHPRPLSLSLAILYDPLEKLVNVHALVDIEKEGYALRWRQDLNVNLLKLADGINVGLILYTLQCFFNFEHLVTVFIHHNRTCVEFFD